MSEARNGVRVPVITWLAVGAAAVAAVMMKDVSGLLADIQTAGERSYDAAVFTGWRFNVFDTQQFGDAIALWRSAQARGLDVEKLLLWHVLVDAILFIPAFAVLIYKVLKRVGADNVFPIVIVVLYVGLDELKTIAAWIVLVGFDLGITSGLPLVLIQLLSSLKWLVLAIAFVAMIGLWRRPEGPTPAKMIKAVSRAHAGEEQSPALALRGLMGLVGVFAAAIALPAGGALDQIPDVIRQHFSEGSVGLWALSTLGFLLFLAAVVVAALAATSPEGVVALAATSPEGVGATGRWLSTEQVLYGAGALSAVLFVAGGLIDGEWGRVVPWAPVIVVLALVGVTRLARAADIAAQPVTRTKGKAIATWTDPALLWSGGLAAAVGIAGPVGMVRAAFPPFVLEVPSGRFPWGLATLIGVAGAIAAGPVVQSTVFRLARQLPKAVHRTIAATTIACVSLVAVWLAAAPPAGAFWGSTGVVAVGFAAWSLVIGLLTWVSRTKPPWEVTQRLGFGARTPWLTLLVVTWLLASFLGKDGGYNDARLLAADDPAPRYETLETAFDSWVDATTEACSPAPGEPLPMVFVAAPGGGIRAAYWTVAVLDELFSPEAGGPCAPARLFALSGVSGGSVGMATWVTATGAGESAHDAVTEMSKDEALPRALAGLLLRDIPQPLTGITTGWNDRAALMERGWTTAAGVFGTSPDPIPWAEAGDGGGLPFVPVMSLNSSSVTDGCRILVTNVGRLPATLGPDCQGVPAPGQPAVGPVSGSIDPFVGLIDRTAAEHPECGIADSDVPVTTAALLSARFPVVSPAGSLVRCVGGEQTTTDAVDGGYYENSGMLTLLQLWEGLDEIVRDYNAGRVENPVEPWFLMADNHYRAQAKKVPPGPPVQFLAPLTAKSQDVLSQTMLEQAAIWEMGGPIEPRFVRLAPTVNPGVEAPLGWVLSGASRENLDEQLAEQIEADDPSLQALLELLRG